MASQTINFFQWTGGVLRTAPALPSVVKGLWNLVTLKPDQIGSLGLRYAELAARQPDAPALIFEGRTWTYAQFNAWANQIAHSLEAAGIRQGDSVGVLMENRAELMACVLGIVKLGAIATLLNNQQRGEPLAHSLRITKPRVVIFGEECVEAFDSIVPALRAELCPQWWFEGASAGPAGTDSLRRRTLKAETSNPPQTAQIKLRQPCFHIFTSGTTGMPKASVMTHYRWHRCMAGLGQLGMRLKSDDVLYCPLPMYHNNALTVSWSSVIGAGACMALGRKFSATRFWDEIRANKATAFCYIGELCRYLLNQPAKATDQQHGVRTIIGNGLRPDIWETFQTRFNIPHIAEFYTASECNLAFVNAFNFKGTAGYCPLPYAIVAFDVENETPIRQADGTMRKVGKGECGLLLTEITDKAPLDGYTDSKATEAKVFRHVFKKGDAWFNTGDLIRDMGFGHIGFVDRVGDTFRWKGENVATTEVEAALGTIDGIEEAVVYGVEVPGADGRAGMAAIRWDDSKGHIDGAALAAALHKALPKYAVPLFIRVREEHEVTATFKHRKVELKREGFDVDKVEDDLYALGENGYELMQRAHPVARRA
ncbi:MAG TPA: long-chain-acyl-CoA synthetase [Aquabacterium sp.]|uniref:long-chain-acyl-CoA synthetase n=1 Tax=Aquabacterium sp. TaxID=1872578 RepID=UPI002E3783ED|nr:long-chain-acyl-CoA synthetase [Aquabacterium sp.]HEX5356300.1 long-chain-acyl-CoA synthetase [Aquabacterium sp.]